MPELPEIHTVVNYLKKNVVDKKITKVAIIDNSIIENISNTQFKKGLLGNRIENVRRRGKYVIIELTNGKNLIVHLRMTGQLIYNNSNAENNKYTRILINLDKNSQLKIGSKRKFTTVNLVDEPDEIKCIREMGPEPLESDFDVEKFKSLFKNRRGMIKPLLMKQRFIAGLGNIYTDEALFLSKIHPKTKANKINEDEKEKLYNSIQKVLKEGIKHNGTTREDYKTASNETGSHQNYLHVYGKDGEECTECDCLIEKIKVSGRGTHYCPCCQKIKN